MRAMRWFRRDRSSPAAPAPLAHIRDRVAGDWIDDKATERARAAATQIEAKVERGMSLARR